MKQMGNDGFEFAARIVECAFHQDVEPTVQQYDDNKQDETREPALETCDALLLPITAETSTANQRVRLKSIDNIDG